MKNLKRIILAAVLTASAMVCLTGCGKKNVKGAGGVAVKVENPNYDMAGYAVDKQVKEDGTVVITYALLGTHEDKIEYLYMDQIENNPKVDKHLTTNKELEDIYGLKYKSSCGEWNQQVAAMENYITGNHMTIEAVNDIPVYKKNSEETMVPKKGSELAAACDIDISSFIKVINEAYEGREEVFGRAMAVGEDIRVNNHKGTLDVNIAFVCTDYEYKVCFSHLKTYSFDADSDENGIILEVNSEDKDNFEEYMYGRNMVAIREVETYSSADGEMLALPKKGTELADVCHIDLYYLLKALNEASLRL